MINELIFINRMIHGFTAKPIVSNSIDVHNNDRVSNEVSDVNIGNNHNTSNILQQ